MNINFNICRKCFKRMSTEYGEGRETRFEIDTPGYDVGGMTQKEIDALPMLYSLARIVKPDWLNERIWNLPCISLTCDKSEAKKVISMTPLRKPNLPLRGVMKIDDVERMVESCGTMTVEVNKHACPYYTEQFISMENDDED